MRGGRAAVVCRLAPRKEGNCSMAVRKLSPGKIVILLLALVFLIGIGTITVVGKKLTPSPYACQTQTVQTIRNLAGGRFTITHTACRDYTHKEFVSVYVQRFVAPDAPFYAHWFNPQTLLFRYHPESWSAQLPELSLAGSQTVVISVPRVSQVDQQRPVWLHLKIRYRIGHVDHPTLAGHD